MFDELEFFSSLEKSEKVNISELLKTENIPKRITKKLKNYIINSNEEFYKILEKIKLESTSLILFPNHYVEFYSFIKEVMAKKSYTCNISGALIKPNDYYYRYQVIIDDLTDNKTYIMSNSLIISNGYQDLLPSNIQTYEYWQYCLKNAYYIENDTIDFYQLSVETSDTALDLVNYKKDTNDYKIKKIRQEIKKMEQLKYKLLKNKKYDDQFEQEINELDKKISKKINTIIKLK